MDSQFLRAAMMGDFNAISDFISNHSADELLQLRVPYSKNTILHLAAEYGHTEAVKAILTKQSLLLCKINSDGDIALHLAAKGGHTEAACELISFVKNLDSISTKLHLAPAYYLYKPLTSIWLRFSDLVLKTSSHVVNTNQNLESWQAMLVLKNKQGNTAVHEAIRFNRIQVVIMLLKENPGFKHSHNVLGETPLYIAASRGFDDLVDLVINNCGSPTCDGPYKRTALHGAVICNSEECTIKLLRWDKSLVNQKDFYLRTPLHYAAQLGYVNLIREMLNVDASSAYVTNIERRNVLHIATTYGQKDVIEFLIEECPLLVNNLITKKDEYGSTPLHLLATFNCFVPKLIHHPMADKGDLNKQFATPLDCLAYNNNANSSTSAAKNEVAEELERAGVTRFQLTSKRLGLDSEKVKKIIENQSVVAALIATMAFTAIFAMPGGYFQSGSPNQGKAVLGKNISFGVFFVSDLVALSCASSSLLLYFLSSVDGLRSKEDGKQIYIADATYFLNFTGLSAIIMAFLAGMFSVLQDSGALTVITALVGMCIYGFMSFLIYIKKKKGPR